MKGRLFKFGCLVIGVAVVLAITAPFLVGDIHHFTLEKRLQPPSPQHLLGLDLDGRDLLGLILYGTKLSLTVSLATVFLSGLFGSLAGIIAGTLGGRWDSFFIFVTDTVLSFPSLLLIIALAAFQRESSAATVILILSAVGWVSYARIARGQVLSLKEREFILAAQAIGVPFRRLCLRHLLPNMIGPLLVNATFAMGGVILAESTLSFLGLGLPPDIPSWGRLLDQGVQYLLIAPHLAIFPGLAMALLILAFNVVGEGLRDYFDVKEN
ncbi:MAG: ABC transporter permease [Deltaproteobacteria bacterium]|nr:ABC transporter permease [Deltaproteobacteria bacterium]